MKVDFAALSPNRVGALIQNLQSRFGALPVWRDSADTCALSDPERHLGHVLRAGGKWIAYDGTRLNPSLDGFRVVGIFPTAYAAKTAVEHNLRNLLPQSEAQTHEGGFVM